MALAFHSNGKLLLTGEYVILMGARALALPLRFGQSMQIKKKNIDGIAWESYYKNKKWFEAQFDHAFGVIETTDHHRANIISRILKEARNLTRYPDEVYLNKQIITQLEFDPDWGWGSSSTLINNIAQWLDLDAYTLSTRTLGGSNYDIACAQSNLPIFFKKYGNAYEIKPALFNPTFKDNLFFVYLGTKQDSRKAVKEFISNNAPSREHVDKISSLTEKIAFTDDLDLFIDLMDQHEKIIGELINKKTVKQELFKDFNGSVKSLGAWGGDFILAATRLSHKETLNYFSTKGYNVLFRFKEISLNKR
jgi:mevalonate kinase